MLVLCGELHRKFWLASVVGFSPWKRRFSGINYWNITAGSNSSDMGERGSANPYSWFPVTPESMSGHAVGCFIFSWTKSIGFSVDRIFKNCIIKTFKASARGFVCILGKREGKIPSGKTFLKEGLVLFIVHKGVEYRLLRKDSVCSLLMMFLVLMNTSAWSSVCLRAGERWQTPQVLLVPQAIVIQIQLSPNSFSVVSLESLGGTSHGSWIRKYSIWSANSPGKMGFLSIGSICACLPLLGCASRLPRVSRRKDESFGLACSLFSGFCFWVQAPAPLTLICVAKKQPCLSRRL